MKRMFFSKILLILTICSVESSLADIDSGIKSFYDEDYATALAEFSKLAEQGDSNAQYWLGLMHQSGSGVKQDYVAAKELFEKAAKQGELGAQMQLAELYLLGHGVEQDNVRAHMWFSIAARHGMKFAEKNRDSVAQQMRASEIARSEELVRAWKPGT